MKLQKVTFCTLHFTVLEQSHWLTAEDIRISIQSHRMNKNQLIINFGTFQDCDAKGGSRTSLLLLRPWESGMELELESLSKNLAENYNYQESDIKYNKIFRKNVFHWY